MKHGLMGQEKIENLGFTEANSWETEEKVIRPRLNGIEETGSLQEVSRSG